jgi:hypothetical protein
MQKMMICLSNQSPLPLNIEGRGKRYGNRHSKKTIALALEYCIGNNLPPVLAAKNLNFPMPTIADWMTKYWFYKKIDNPIILTLQSNV